MFARHRLRLACLAAGAAVTFVAAGLQEADPPDQRRPADDPGDFNVLVFSKTAGFRHDSIPDGIAAIRKLGENHHFTIDSTEDAAAFTSEKLAQYECIVFLSTTGDVLNEEQQRAFEHYIQAGGGYAGIHAASDTEYDWPWYGRLVGSYFSGHPAIQDATILVADRAHPSTRHLPERWQRHDEWYNYKSNPRDRVHVLATLDETSYQGGTMGSDHPIAWWHEFDGGRAWYTGGGHTKESFSEPDFLQHLLGGIRWAAGVADSNDERRDGGVGRASRASGAIDSSRHR
jgi:cytochrome c